MTRLLCLLWIASSLSLTITAQDFYVQNYQIETNLIDFNGTGLHFEIPPVIYTNGFEEKIISTTHYSATVLNICNLANFESQTYSDSEQSPRVTARPLIWNKEFGEFDYLNAPKIQHKRNYNGIFSVHALEEQNLIVSVHHGENKNEMRNNILFQNSVMPSAEADESDTNSYSGMINGRYKEDWDSYFAFLNVSVQTGLDNPLTQLDDLGPVVWPSHGYLAEDGSKSSYGLRHPTSIIHHNYLYIFYSDSKHPMADSDPERKPGKKLARVHLDSVNYPKAYKVYYNAGWVEALPKGFSKERQQEFYNVKGPKATPLFENSGCIGRFSVAKVKDENYFISVEEYRDKNDGYKTKIAVRYSFDLINWTERQELPNCTWDKWKQGNMHYPVFMNKEGNSTTEVDLGEFYILGTSSQNHTSLTRKRFSLKPIQSIYSPDGKQLDLHQMSVFPNPTRNEAFLHINNPEYENLEVTITDKRGNVMYKSDHYFTFENWNKPFRLSIEMLSHGIYFLNVKGESFLQQSKLIIK